MSELIDISILIGKTLLILIGILILIVILMWWHFYLPWIFNMKIKATYAFTFSEVIEQQHISSSDIT